MSSSSPHGEGFSDFDSVALGIGWALLRWARLADDEDAPLVALEVIDRFGEVIQHSSIPEAAATVGESLAEAPA